MKFVYVTIAAGLMLAGCNTSYNYFQEDRAEVEGDGKGSLFGSALTIAGVIPPQQKQIDYKPRAPIAVPGTNELPTPGANASVLSDVNFPEDQDSAEARRRAELNSTLAYEGRIQELGNNSNTNLTAEQVAAGRREGGGLNGRSDTWRANADPFGNVSSNLNRQDMSVVVRTPRRGGDVLTEEGEAAPRKYLIQPPTEYRTPAESAALPDRKEIENSEWARSRLYQIDDKTPRRLQQ